MLWLDIIENTISQWLSLSYSSFSSAPKQVLSAIPRYMQWMRFDKTDQTLTSTGQRPNSTADRRFCADRPRLLTRRPRHPPARRPRERLSAGRATRRNSARPGVHYARAIRVPFRNCCSPHIQPCRIVERSCTTERRDPSRPRLGAGPGGPRIRAARGQVG